MNKTELVAGLREKFYEGNDPKTYLSDSSPVDPGSDAPPDGIDIRNIP